MAKSKQLYWLGGGLALALTLGGCANVGLHALPEAPPGMIQVIRMPSESIGSVQGLVNYNFLGSNPVVRTWLFEPLMIRDEFTCDAIPWLATGYEWETPERMLLHVREGVVWTDGEPFTANDVVFNFNMGQEWPAADRSGLWTSYFGAAATSVTALDDYTVEFVFEGNAVMKTDAILRTQILPEHVYAHVGDPTLFIDANPVSTGPFVPESYNGRRLVMERNPTYWNAENLYVQYLVLEGSFDANSAALRLRTNALDIYLGDIPNPARSVEGHGVSFFYPPGGTAVVAMNMTDPITGDVAFREAFAYAVDKEALALRASFGIMTPGSQTMLKLPMQQPQVPAQWVGEEFIPYDPAHAEAILDAAGYQMQPNGFRNDPQGQPFHVVFSVQAGWMDYIAMVDVIVRGLQDVGIDARMVTTDPNAIDSMKKSGSYQMVLDTIGGGCQRSVDLGGRLITDQISEGDRADQLLLNIARFADPAIDQLVADWGANTDPSRDSYYLDQIIDVYMEQFPYVAMQYAPQRLIYNTDTATGWPSVDNPYPVNSLLRIMMELRPPN